jgi:hypothetical protein
VIAPPHPSALPETELLKQCQIGRGRGSGPGGQHRNKVETEITITHLPTGLIARAGERRSAEENRRVAVMRLRLRLATEHRHPVPAGEVRSALWRSRCSPDGRLACNPRHADFPALLAEALDVIAACHLDPRKAALRLCCSPSQLVKLVKDHPPALEWLNRERDARKLHPLR